MIKAICANKMTRYARPVSVSLPLVAPRRGSACSCTALGSAATPRRAVHHLGVYHVPYHHYQQYGLRLFIFFWPRLDQQPCRHVCVRVCLRARACTRAICVMMGCNDVSAMYQRVVRQGVQGVGWILRPW